MASIDCIFFDVDGTLVDARLDITNAMNYALTSLGCSKVSPQDITSYVGYGVKDLVRKSLGTCGNEEVVDKATELYWKYFMKHAVDETILYPHVKEILD